MENSQNCHLPGVEEATRRLAGEALDRYSVKTSVSAYSPFVASARSGAGGKPSVPGLEWPVDRNKNALRFLARVDFEDLVGMPDLPAAKGVLSLFISPDYASFRPKDQSWYRLIYSACAEPLESPLYSLVFRRFDYIPERFYQAALSAVPEEEQAAVAGWLNGLLAEAECVDVQQFLGVASQKAQRAATIAAFHGNGISYDEARRVDPHYKHLVDGANELVVLWRLGGLNRILAAEKRELFICINRQDLINMDFQRALAVFL